ncbi:MAG TPA: 2-dehydro-3-deoxyphosphogluconate aldolase [Blastocatellia bacterium]|jgi:2-dehydro-3-deoxyphosphogluconate aldolase/(4S)-4-hydroxy-2-oxoglutarate aldolase|nr:2-dehydro-3-deoxyphosphogluconate aldolase [Blastocatellia bacterium]HCX31466.1 2-dehydro-3-deoxyphosphogluconate aldolase [Blastocatellia bacterium]
MEKAWVLKRIEEVGVIPVVRAASAEEAIAVAEVIGEGGIPILEITLTVPGAVAVIGKLSKRYGDKVLVGAGTVLDAEAARRCIGAGAQFIVSPSLNIATIELCKRQRIAVFPGALTPTEVVSAWQAGADAVKVFPCNAVGGPKYLRALKAPLPQVNLVPTGGVTLATAKDFIAAGAWALGVGGDLVNTKAINSGERESVVAAARSYVTAVREARTSMSDSQ